MKLKNRLLLPVTCGLSALLCLAGCGQKPAQESAGAAPDGSNSRGGNLSIVAGSENKSLEPIVQEFARRRGVGISMAYMGSVEIGHELAKGTQCQFDSVWPAASLWIARAFTVDLRQANVLSDACLSGVRALPLSSSAGDLGTFARGRCCQTSRKTP